VERSFTKMRTQLFTAMREELWTCRGKKAGMKHEAWSMKLGAVWVAGGWVAEEPH